MKLYKNERRVFSKFAPVTRKQEFEFGGVIEFDNGKSYLSTITCRFKIEAMRHFQAIAKREKGKLNIKTVRVLN